MDGINILEDLGNDTIISGKNQNLEKDSGIKNDEKKNDEKKNDEKKDESADKKPSKYEQYYLDHTGENMAKSKKDMLDDLSRCMAAFVLDKLGRKFSNSDIEMVGRQFKEVYFLKNLKKEELQSALQNPESVRETADQRRESMYGMNDEQYKALVNEMKIMKQVMEGKKGRSSKYGAMYDAMDHIASGETLKEKDPEKRKEMITNDVLSLYESIMNYMEGKEKIRWSDKGKLAFDQGLDMMASIVQCGRSKILLERTKSKIEDINLIRTGGVVKEGYISTIDFYSSRGVKHAVNQRRQYNEDHNLAAPEIINPVKDRPKMQ